jgi:hypothetical protein
MLQWKRLTFLEKSFISNAGKIYFISDGAIGIKKLKNDYFPQAIGVLDI